MRGGRRWGAALAASVVTAGLAFVGAGLPAAAAPADVSVDVAVTSQTPVGASTSRLTAAPTLTAPPTVTAPTAAPAAGDGTLAATAAPDWLRAVNIYRKAAGVGPVTENAVWSSSIVKHLRYTVEENDWDHPEAKKSSPYYTPEGEEAGLSSNLRWGYYGSAVADITGWMAAPYHGVGILRPTLTKVAYASYTGQSVFDRAAGLDVIRGLDWHLPAPTSPVLFPGPGLTVQVGSFAGNEFPDPLAHCPATFRNDPGLPIIVMMPDKAANPATVKASVRDARGVVASTANKSLCVVDGDGDYAFFLIANKSYANGAYKVSVTVPGATPFSWSFAVDSRYEMPRLGCDGIPDIPGGSTQCNDVHWLLDTRMTSLTAAGGFKPADNISRAATAAYLYRATHAGKKAPACKAAPYRDVPANYAACGEVAWLKTLGVNLAYPDGTFRINTLMDRSTLAMLMYKIGNPGKTPPACKVRAFKDVAVTDKACTAMVWVEGQKLLAKRTDGNFKPTAPIVRGQLPALLRYAAAHS